MNKYDARIAPVSKMLSLMRCAAEVLCCGIAKGAKAFGKVMNENPVIQDLRDVFGNGILAMSINAGGLRPATERADYMPPTNHL
jgi:hypothetical protein